jgi:OOP family OmpA-OmpF porin
LAARIDQILPKDKAERKTATSNRWGNNGIFLPYPLPIDCNNRKSNVSSGKKRRNQQISPGFHSKGHPMNIHFLSKTLINCCLALFVLCTAPFAVAQTGPLEKGWTLQSESSVLNFQSVKNQTIVESSSFATLAGTIDESGATEVAIMLESVDTKIDLRNVRMRFLFFESFQFPEATITVQLDPADLADLPTVRRKTINLAYTLDLHGVSKTSNADVVVTLLSDNLVSVATTTPISVAAADFNLISGIEKLQEAAKVEIIPSSSVTFDFMFARNGTTEPAAATTEQPTTTPAKVALEAEGNFSAEECSCRFEILSRTNNIYFASGSATLQDKSAPLLNTLADILSRCPGMVVEIGGHTDDVGSDDANQRLSERRAASVVEYLTAKGINATSMVSVGYGETKPKADNKTKKGRWDNRRIEFLVIKG